MRVLRASASSPLGSLFCIVALCGLFAPVSRAGVLFYGDADVLGSGAYPDDPTRDATLEGLPPDVVTFSSVSVRHGWPFSPDAGDHPGTDQIYVGSNQTASHDGYSGSSSRQPGPQVIVLDYGALVPPGMQIATLTLGIAADDFQFPVFGQPFEAQLNGQPAPALTDALNGLVQTGPVVQFFSIGIDPAVLTPDHVLTLTIDESGDGGDGWAIDFLTVGVTSVPEPNNRIAVICGAAVISCLLNRRR